MPASRANPVLAKTNEAERSSDFSRFKMSSRTLFVKSTGNRIHESCKIYGTSVIGKNCTILENVILGYPSNKVLNELQTGDLILERHPFVGACIGDNAVIRSNTTIYC